MNLLNLDKRAVRNRVFTAKIHDWGENPTDLPRVWGDVNEKLGSSGIGSNLRYHKERKNEDWRSWPLARD